MKSLFKKCIVVLGFVLFFALFPSNGEPISAYASEIEEPTVTDTPTETQAEIKLSVKTKSLVKDLQYELKVYNLTASQTATFESSFPKVATVDEKGVIQGISNGTTVITVTIKEGSKTIETLTCDVTVGPPAINVKWIKSEVVMVVGKRITLKTIVLPYNTAESAMFFSADTNIVTVNSTGRMTAKEIGVTYVFTAIDNGKYDFCKVTVVDEETYQKMLDEAQAAGEFIEAEPEETTEPAEVTVTEEAAEPTEPAKSAESDNQVLVNVTEIE